jgi:predicted RNase H-like HicB family nuclease
VTDVTNFKEYDIHVHWDSRAEYFVAEIPGIFTCAADGATQAEALAKLEGTFAILREAYLEDGLTFPGPRRDTRITVGDLSALSDVLKISRLAELSGIPGQTLATKLRRLTEFTPTEADRITQALDMHGLALSEPRFVGRHSGS